MEGTLGQALPWLVGSLCLIAALCLLRRPLTAMVRLASRTGLGLAALCLLAPVGRLVGAGLGINLFNALVLGTLGAPGLGLLLLWNWALR